MSLLLWRSDRAYLVEPGERLETDLGIIEVTEELTPGETVSSHLGDQFLVLEPRPTDFCDHLDRAGAPMLSRDIGLIIGLAGMTAGDRVLDVGTGTGILAITLGKLDIEVTTVERDAEAAAIARENITHAGVSEYVTLREADATALSFDDSFDAMTLDTSDAPQLAARAPEVLRPGGVVAAYSPFVEDARSIVEELTAASLTEIESYDPFHRTMEFGSRGSRPSTTPVGHTGFITVARHRPEPEGVAEDDTRG